jgi:iron complex outermembrane receptor protein
VTASHSLNSAQDQTFGARWITDANASYTLLRKYTFTAGADNLFDVYPASDPFNLPFVNGIGTHSPYNAVSPFGFNGRFIFARLSIYL